MHNLLPSNAPQFIQTQQHALKGRERETLPAWFTIITLYIEMFE